MQPEGGATLWIRQGVWEWLLKHSKLGVLECSGDVLSGPIMGGYGLGTGAIQGYEVDLLSQGRSIEHPSEIFC